jgi:CHAT domain-containing protein
VFSQWAFVYDRFSGRLLRGLPGSSDPDADLELALQVTERMRARVLLEEMDVALAAIPTPIDGGPYRERQAVLREITAVQRRLADASLPPPRRAEELSALEALEQEERALRDELVREDAAFARLRATDAPSVAEIRDRLRDDELLLSYQLSSAEPCASCWTDEGGSWLIGVTRRNAFALPLPDEHTLEQKIAVFLGMLRRRDGSDEPAAAALYEDLLAGGLERTGSSVRRLVIVPDGCLHHLPFGSLRAEPGAPSLVERLEIAIVPSVTLWHRWRAAPAGGRVAPRVLSLADPAGAKLAGTATRETTDPWIEGLRLGALPFARREASALIRSVGGGSRLLTGTAASERALKEADLQPFGLLHLAAHAVVDHEHPSRSAVLLAPGSEEEDGLLQVREIVDLPLRDKVILLTGCRSASGAVLEGEGTLGLARAFFQAGARTVVGSLWPIRDDEAEIVVRSFSRELARGRRVSAALAIAQGERARAGVPTEAWAGLVAIGDGGATLVPAAVSPPRSRAWLPAFLLICALAVLALWLRVSRPPPVASR